MDTWNELHTALKQSMQKEVTLLRDLLANLHQEELSLLMHDRHSWNQLMEERANIVKHLGSSRLARSQAIEKLSADRADRAEAKLEELLPLQDENSCQILSLRDQIVALTERMNKQSVRNQILYAQVEKKFDLPPEQLRPKPVSHARRRRNSVTTQPFNLE